MSNIINLQPGEALTIRTPLGSIVISAGNMDRKKRSFDSITIEPILNLVDGCKVKVHGDRYQQKMILNKTPERMIPGKGWD